MGVLFKNGDLFLILGLFGTVLLMILPVPPFFLDLFLAVSIALSLLILLAILYVKTPAEFTGFPTLLLFITLYRLSLNVASTRLILLDGYAGHIIEAFGNFVVRGNYVVGLVIFLILVLINFIVITKGAGRIAEVAARFTLDAMPGKQMAIDAELNAGIINEAEARTRRRKVEQEADFYGAMDGASKIVRGDAVAAILITLINVLGGFAIGIMQKGMTVNEALQRFTLLSIGDGLVSQIPALITSTAAGILVTRAAAKEELGSELTRQLLAYPKVLAILTAMLLIFALVPGLPMIPFLTLASLTGFLAYNLRNQPQFQPRSMAAETAGEAATAAAGGAAKAASGAVGDKLESLLGLDALQIELGYGLVGLADVRKGGDLLERVTGVRKNFAQEMGVIIPPIRLRDNLQLDPNQYWLRAQEQSDRPGRIATRLLARDERFQQQDSSQGPPDCRTRVQAAGHLGHGCRTQERGDQRLYGCGRRLRARHPPFRDRQAQLPRDPQPPGCPGPARQPQTDQSDRGQ